MDVYADGRATAIGLTLVERRPGDGLCAALQAWYLSAFPGDAEQESNGDLVVDGPDQDAVIRCAGTGVFAGIGPDVATASSLLPDGAGTVALDR